MPPVAVISTINWFINSSGTKLLICVAKTAIPPSYKTTGIAENTTPIPRVVVNIIEINPSIIALVNKIL